MMNHKSVSQLGTEELVSQLGTEEVVTT